MIFVYQFKNIVIGYILPLICITDNTYFCSCPVQVLLLLITNLNVIAKIKFNDIILYLIAYFM